MRRFTKIVTEALLKGETVSSELFLLCPLYISSKFYTKYHIDSKMLLSTEQAWHSRTEEGHLLNRLWRFPRVLRTSSTIHLTNNLVPVRDVAHGTGFTQCAKVPGFCTRGTEHVYTSQHLPGRRTKRLRLRLGQLSGDDMCQASLVNWVWFLEMNVEREQLTAVCWRPSACALCQIRHTHRQTHLLHTDRQLNN